MSKVKDRRSKNLHSKPTVITRAVLWKIPHNTAINDVRLKVGRYTKPKNITDDELPETLTPKSELTLDNEELMSLVDFLRENYEPFKQGVKAFIPLDRPYDQDNAAQIRALFSLPEKSQLVDFILTNKIIPEDLAIGLQHARRVRAIRYFEQMLTEDSREALWQIWFQRNSWVLGSQFVRVLDERQVDAQHIVDFLMEAYDGFLDIVEIKRPEGGMYFWSATMDHGNYVPSGDLIKAITQASRYIYEVERESNSVKFLERVGQVKTVKPRCVLIFGRSHDWNRRQIEAYRILNAGYHNLTVMTYDHVLTRAKRIVGLTESKGSNS